MHRWTTRPKKCCMGKKHCRSTMEFEVIMHDASSSRASWKTIKTSMLLWRSTVAARGRGAEKQHSSFVESWTCVRNTVCKQCAQSSGDRDQKRRWPRTVDEEANTENIREARRPERDRWLQEAWAVPGRSSCTWGREPLAFPRLDRHKNYVMGSGFVQYVCSKTRRFEFCRSDDDEPRSSDLIQMRSGTRISSSTSASSSGAVDRALGAETEMPVSWCLSEPAEDPKEEPDTGNPSSASRSAREPKRRKARGEADATKKVKTTQDVTKNKQQSWP